ncbi:MAG: exo 1,3/1,4-beta-D-glucan glucohydrolase, partial [Kangiellaceae bacterium]|nr:exo 1,3/1,4-beta-D-glucan glucohydrolase [Kangiellaceae bacterium]
LNGGGAFPNNEKHSTMADWIELAEKMYQASIDDSLDGSNIPTMWGTDAVHGHNNVIGATLFPHNIGLGAANNIELMEQIAQATATEVMVTGIDWVFAPTVATVRDDRWGRTYEGYSEDPKIVKQYAAAVVRGLQGTPGENFLGDNRVISTVKHFVGDGGTVNGVDQGNNIASEKELFDIHGQGYVGGLQAGAQSVMASFNSWHSKKNHGNKYLLTDVLKEQMGFDGFVVGDWNGHGQIAGCTNENCPQAINAGLDIFMVPTDAWKPLYENTIQQVNNGTIPLSRIDDAVRRILRVKHRAGLFDKPSPANRIYSGKRELIGSKEHRALARRAVQQSLVLLKNKNNLLPLSPKQNILITGDGADNIGKQSGGWTITWQGTGNTNQDFPGGTSIYQGLAEQINNAGGQAILSIDGHFDSKPDIAIVVFGEEPYAEGQGDREDVSFYRENKKPLELLNQFKEQGIPVVSLFISGRPMWVNAELNASDSFVAIWLPGSEGQGIADVILKDSEGHTQNDFIGKLSYSWPNTPTQSRVNKGDENYSPLLPYGFGLRYNDTNFLADDLQELFAQTPKELPPVVIFNGTTKKPWQLLLFAGEYQFEANSNVHQFPGLSYKTTDKNIQEDAFNIRIDGSVKAGVKIVSFSNRIHDLKSTTESTSALQFSIKLQSHPSDEVNLSIYCSEGESCGHSLNLTNKLSQIELSKWHQLTVNLSCFTENGMKLAQTISPFELSSSGPLNLDIADISIVHASKEYLSNSCH